MTSRDVMRSHSSRMGAVLPVYIYYRLTNMVLIWLLIQVVQYLLQRRFFSEVFFAAKISQKIFVREMRRIVCPHFTFCLTGQLNVYTFFPQFSPTFCFQKHFIDIPTCCAVA
jgi:hypothetical protein